ncbi:MAG: hypothetical protein ACOX4L_02195 [Bacillota bacterium]
MKRKKRTAMIGAFALGALLFAGTALADIMDKSGYDQLKDAVKVTAVNCTENYQSFTAEFSMVMKDNGKVILSEDSVTKYNAVNGTKEEISTTKDATNRKMNNSYYSYSDKNQCIVKSADDNKYIVTTYRDKKDKPLINKEDNPFNQDEAKDMERILDALVSNLKDQVIVTEDTDGSKSLSGKLSEGQIPALINALASFQMKHEFNGNRGGIVDLASDVYVKEVRGTAKISKDGSLENILGTASISGLDKEGKVHDISIEVLFKLSDVNATKVTKPDLTGKKVITQKERDVERAHKPTPEKFVGKFKNDIIMENDGRFVKIGERHLEITLFNDKEIQGKYWEELKEGFEKYTDPDSSYTFKARFNDKEKDANNAVFEGITKEGNKITGNLHFNGYDGRVYMNLDGGYYENTVINDTDFRPDLD